jgi:hypothetical protein
MSLVMTGVLALAVVIGPSGASINRATIPAAPQNVPSQPGQIEPAGPIDLGPDIEGLRQPNALGELADPALRALVKGSRQTAEIRVEVLHTLSTDAIHDLITSLGGTIVGEVPGELVEADVPAGRLGQLERRDGIDQVRQPLEIQAPPDSAAPVSLRDIERAVGGAVIGEEVALTNVANWHAAGVNGGGIRIGIIDVFNGSLWSAAQAAGEVRAPSGTFCRLGSSACSLFSAGGAEGAHGVAVAEIIHEMAPGASLYLATVGTTSDLQAAVNYFASQGVRIISRSLGSRYDGPGNGTGPIDTVVASAVSKGIAWFNSSGNSGGGADVDGGYWRGSWADTDADGWLDFAPGQELLAHDCSFFFGLRWSDWSSSRTDYDLYLFDEVSSTSPWASGEADQTAGAAPIEHPVDAFGNPSVLSCPGGVEDVDYLAIRLFSAGGGTSGDKLEVLVNGRIEGWSNPFAAAIPASDSSSGGAISVGAVDPVGGATIAQYSSQGPTNSNRMKPDLSAASCMASFTYTDCFNGTSAAAPVAAAVGALTLDAGWASTPAGVRNFLMRYLVRDRGATGGDNVYGAGEIILPKFADTATSPHVHNIDWVLDEGITAGCSPGRYCPHGLVTRGQMATFLVRALGLPGTPTDFFTDDAGSVHEPNINRLAAAGITAGCAPRRYCPDGVVTRAQMATFLVRALGLPGTSTDFFTDDTGLVHEPNINRLAAAGITAGCGASTYCPSGSVTRAQMATFLRRGLT